MLLNRIKAVVDPTLVADSGHAIADRLQDLLDKIQKDPTDIGSAIDAYYKQHIVGTMVHSFLSPSDC